MKIASFLKTEFRDWRKWLPILLALICFFLMLHQLYLMLNPSPIQLKGKPTFFKNDKEVYLHKHSTVFSAPLFGVYVSDSSLVKSEIKKSTLGVKIVGIMFTKNEKEAQVIIKDGGEEKIYYLNQSLSQGAVIKKISKDGIVLLHQGVLESLSFPKQNLVFEPPEKPLLEDKA